VELFQLYPEIDRAASVRHIFLVITHRAGKDNTTRVSKCRNCELQLFNSHRGSTWEKEERKGKKRLQVHKFTMYDSCRLHHWRGHPNCTPPTPEECTDELVTNRAANNDRSEHSRGRTRHGVLILVTRKWFAFPSLCISLHVCCIFSSQS
jgi:hypothetical protein